MVAQAGACVHGIGWLCFGSTASQSRREPLAMAYDFKLDLDHIPRNDGEHLEYWMRYLPKSWILLGQLEVACRDFSKKAGQKKAAKEVDELWSWILDVEECSFNLSQVEEAQKPGIRSEIVGDATH